MSKRCSAAWVAVRRGRANRSRTSGGCLVGLKRSDWREGGETGGARLRPWARVEPRDKAVEIDGGSDRDVLQGGLRHAPIPALAQATGADPLGERPFDAGPALIELLAFLVVVLGRQAQPSACVFGPGTASPHGTRPTRVLVTFYNDGATALATPMLPPRDRQVALGAAHVLLVPVDGKLINGVRPVHLGLPALAGARGASQEDALVVSAVDEEFRADIRCIDQVFPRRDVLVNQCLLDGRGALRFMTLI